MEKIRYEIDPHNRLVIKGLGLEKFRTVLDGSFRLDEKGALTYHVKKSSGIDCPQQVKISGNWSLDEDHNLVLTLDKWNNQAEANRLVLKSEILSAGGDELAFSVQTRDARRGRGKASIKIYVLKFSGAWQADKYNRLAFNIEKEEGAGDKLTFQGKWEIDKHNEIVYASRGGKNVLSFKGHWAVTAKDRLSYVLNKDLGSRFDFKVSYEKAAKDSLRVGVTVGVGEKKRSIALSGRWRLDRDLGLFFEIGYSGGSVRAKAQLLKSFSQGRGEAYWKALVSEKEFAVMAGAGLRW
jgi:hypothetical protein